MIQWLLKRFFAIFEPDDPEVMFLRLRAHRDRDILWQTGTLKETDSDSNRANPKENC